jgi:hypothetical protein
VDRSLDKRAKVVGKLTYILDLLAQGNQFSQEAFRALLARSVQGTAFYNTYMSWFFCIVVKFKSNG